MRLSMCRALSLVTLTKMPAKVRGRYMCRGSGWLGGCDVSGVAERAQVLGGEPELQELLAMTLQMRRPR